MTRKEAIDLLDNLIGMVEDNHNSNYDEALNMAIKALEQEPRWIPVSERLPRKEGDYLVTVRNKEYGFQYIDITTYEHSEWGYKDEWQVIAWINVPSEYKEEREGK